MSAQAISTFLIRLISVSMKLIVACGFIFLRSSSRVLAELLDRPRIWSPGLTAALAKSFKVASPIPEVAPKEHRDHRCLGRIKGSIGDTDVCDIDHGYLDTKRNEYEVDLRGREESYCFNQLRCHKSLSNYKVVDYKASGLPNLVLAL
jgi:hypothetical protein